MNAMLELDAIDKRFSRRSEPVLRQVSLTAAPGAVTVVQGRSGGGKTTLLRIIAGLEAPDAGRVRLGGRDLAAVPPEARDTGLAFQSLLVYPHLDVAGNVRMAAEAGGARGRDRADRIEQSLAATGLAGIAGRPAAVLSGGQLQRLALARMLARRPRVCLLDEPLAHLDPEARLHLRELLAGLRAAERVVLLVTHDAGEAMRLADRLAILGPEPDAPGSSILAEGHPAALAEDPPSLAAADATGLEPVNLLPVALVAAHPELLATPPAPRAAAHLAVRPEAMPWSRRDDASRGMDATVVACRPVPGGTEVVLDVPAPRPLRLRLPADAAAASAPPEPGTTVRVRIPDRGGWWFDAGGRRVG